MSDAGLTLEAIPHRPPFLFVDEIVEASADRIVTRTLADPKADFFRGHYPNQPVMPGVLICECCFQAGALLLAHRVGADELRGVPVLTRISDARFKRMVKPGQTLTAEVTLGDVLHGAYFLTGRANVEDRLAARVSFVCMLAEASGDSM